MPLVAGKLSSLALTEGILDGLIEIGAMPLAQRENCRAESLRLDR